ncbi:MAG TPA: hypothetical protein VHG90_15530, partial [Acidimicrobiales bacterium]|nr:hypothetical protein [Acidimicrobiales bacterium]
MNLTTSVVLADKRHPDPGGRRRLPGRLLRCHPAQLRTHLGIFAAWWAEANLELFGVRRAHFELFGRWMEEDGKMRSSVARRGVARP